MDTDQLQNMINWLNLQIGHLNKAIKEAHQANNYGRELQYEGMRDAFIIFLIKYVNTNGEKENSSKHSESSI